ncbi:MAG: DUF6483 family protein [Chloroflexota bacterium]
MKKEDYLLRILEEMALHIGRMVKQALALQNEGQRQEAHETISQAIEDLVKLPTERLVRLDFDVILDRIKNAGVWEERAFYLGQLLKQDADFYKAEDDDTAVYLRQVLALKLWLSLDVQSEEPLVTVEQIDQLIDELDEYQHHSTLYHQMMTFYLGQKQFANAENVLFEWLESEVALQDIDQFNPMEHGLEFYEQLDSLDDAILEAGGLPRAELINGKNELLAFYEEE